MARSSVTQSLGLEGLGVGDVARKVSSLRAIWFRWCLTTEPHLWTVFFEYHVNAIFLCPLSALLERDSIAVYRINKLHYASLIYAWVSLRGCRDNGVWVIPRLSGDPLPVAQLTAQFVYTILSHYEHVEHRSLAKFQDLHVPSNGPKCGHPFVYGTLFVQFRTPLGCHFISSSQRLTVLFASV